MNETRAHWIVADDPAISHLQQWERTAGVRGAQVFLPVAGFLEEAAACYQAGKDDADVRFFEGRAYADSAWIRQALPDHHAVIDKMERIYTNLHAELARHGQLSD